MYQEQTLRAVASSRNHELSDLIDVPVLQAMMNDYYSVTGVGVAIIDMFGKMLITTGTHHDSGDLCKFCHAKFRSSVPTISQLESHRCLNNLWNTVTPITVNGKHIGNIFLEQFHYTDEVLKIDLLRSQSYCLGSDFMAHLSALNHLPRLSKRTVQSAKEFYSRVALMISHANYTDELQEANFKQSREGQLAVTMDKSKTSWNWQMPSEMKKDEGSFQLEEANDEWMWVSVCGKMIEVDVDGKALRDVGTLNNIIKRR